MTAANPAIGAPSNGCTVPIIVLLGGILVAALVLPGIGQVQTGEHAVERHGTDALAGHLVCSQTGEPYNCKDGKKYSISATGPEEWFAVILEEVIIGGETIIRERTTFWCDDGDYLVRVLNQDGCDSTKLPEW